MSLANVIYKLGLARSLKDAEQTILGLKKVAANPAGEALGGMREAARHRAASAKPSWGVKTEFYDTPKPITKQLDNSARNAAAKFRASDGDGAYFGLGGTDHEYINLSRGRNGKYSATRSAVFEKLHDILARGERFARISPYSLEGGLASGGTAYYLAKQREKEMEMSPLEKLKMKLESL
jgi:hypothetical protein